jgi:hypothetical protein
MGQALFLKQEKNAKLVFVLYFLFVSYFFFSQQ